MNPAGSAGATTTRWPHSLTVGTPGLLLLQIAEARAGSGSWAAVQASALTMTAQPVSGRPDECSLFDGAPAVAFALRCAGQPAYAGAVTRLDEHIETATRQRLDAAHERIERGHLPQLREFDLISGLTGIGAYLLYRHHHDQHCDDDLLRDVLTYLIRLTHPLEGRDREALPGWWSGQAPTGRVCSDWPGGHANFGIAHGIAGPLALLSMAMRRSVTMDGQSAAIRRICAWLESWRQDAAPVSAWWPGTISRTELRTARLNQAGPQRPSWCYGTPGLARAQQLAGLALDDVRLSQDAETALTGCVSDEHQVSLLSDPSLCHGRAGFLLALWRAAEDSAPDSSLFKQLHRLLSSAQEQGKRLGAAADRGGLLEGATGIQLAWHTIRANLPPIGSWDACLLLSG